MGLRFDPPGPPSHWYYGWIRVSLSNNCGMMLIKDWAYNSDPDSPILAGQTMRLGTVVESPVAELKIYSYGKQIHITDNFNNEELQVMLFNQLGELAFKKSTNKITSATELNELPSGIYLIKIESESTSISKQILIE